MADEATQVSQDTSVEQTTVGSQPETQAGETTSQEANNASGSNAETASSSDKGSPATQDSKLESKPVSRRSAAYRIQQLVEENKALRQQQRPQQQDDYGDTTAQDDKPDIASLVAKEIERRLNPIVSESTRTADDAEISELFSGDKAAERSKYEPQIREMWKLPQYKDVAASDLHAMLVGRNMDSIVSAAVAKAIEDFKRADKEARDSSTSGTPNSNRTRTGSNLSDLSDKEILERNEKIKAGLKV